MSSNPFRTGAFVLSGLILLLVTLFLLGLSDLFVPKRKFVTLVRESVQGLDVGSTVRYRGVPVGNVTAIRIQTHDKLIRIEMEIREQPFTSTHSDFGSKKEARDQFQKFFNHELNEGNLRLKLNYAGITGLKYVELDYFDTSNEKNRISPPKNLTSDEFYVYSQPSVFTDMLRTISVSLDKVSKIDFETISKNTQNALEQFAKVISNPSIMGAIENAEIITRSLSNACDEKSVKELKEKFSNFIASAAELTADMKKTLRAAKVDETADDVRKTAVSMEAAVTKLERTIDSLNLLLDYLNRDPSALVHGKNVETVNPGKLQ